MPATVFSYDENYLMVIDVYILEVQYVPPPQLEPEASAGADKLARLGAGAKIVGVYWYVYSVEWQHWTQIGGSRGTRRATCRTNNSIFSCSCCIPVQHGMYVELYVCREHFNTLFGNNIPIYVKKLRCTDL